MHALAAATASHAGADLIVDLAVIMAVAALTTVVFQRLRQPLVLGYLLAGLIVGPHLPIPLSADENVARDLSELGVILLMFSLGLEFRIRTLVKVAPVAGVIALIECSLQLWLGYAVGRALGWTGVEGLFLGAMVAISSTTIIVKAFAEQKIGGLLGELVFGILVVEDLVAVLLLAVLTAVGSGAGLSAGALALTVAKLAAFLLGTLAFGMLVVPRTVRAIVRLGRLGRDETTTVAAIGICFSFALLARGFGYSVALGAFLGGALVAESGEEPTIGKLIAPVRDMFAAIFFVSVGMQIAPHGIFQNWSVVLVITLVVVLGKVIGVTTGAFLTGNGVPTAVRAGMSFAQIGEFSFIIAGLGLSLGAIRGSLYPVAVAVSALTAFTTPWLIRAAGPTAAYLDRRLPRPLQTYTALYGDWVARLRHVRGQRTIWARFRRLVLLLFVDVCGIAAIIIAASLSAPAVDRFMGRVLARFGWTLTPLLGGVLLIAVGAVIAAPFALGAIRVARALGVQLAIEALPSTGAVDLSAAPRRALVVTIQIGVLLVVGIPLLAVTQPFLPSVPGFTLLLLMLLALVIPLWRSAINLQEHVRAGAQIVLEQLASQSQDTAAHRIAPAGNTPALPQRALAGMGAATTIRLDDDSPAVGRSLKQLALRGRTSATVIAIERSAAGVIYPTADEVLVAGDVLVLTGSAEAVDAARALLDGESPPLREPPRTA